MRSREQGSGSGPVDPHLLAELGPAPGADLTVPGAQQYAVRGQEAEDWTLVSCSRTSGHHKNLLLDRSGQPDSPVNARTGLRLSAPASGLRAADTLEHRHTGESAATRQHGQVRSVGSPEHADLPVVVPGRQEASARREALREHGHVETLWTEPEPESG